MRVLPLFLFGNSPTLFHFPTIYLVCKSVRFCGDTYIMDVVSPLALPRSSAASYGRRTHLSLNGCPSDTFMAVSGHTSHERV